MSLKHRRWHHFRANLLGYYWLPCPSCGQMFGGHEQGGGTLYLEGGETWAKGKSLCPDCPDNIYAPGYVGFRMAEEPGA